MSDIISARPSVPTSAVVKLKMWKTDIGGEMVSFTISPSRIHLLCHNFYTFGARL
jgi:hypothetical protein